MDKDDFYARETAVLGNINFYSIECLDFNPSAAFEQSACKPGTYHCESSELPTDFDVDAFLDELDDMKYARTFDLFIGKL